MLNERYRRDRYRVTPAGALTTLYSFYSQTTSSGGCLDGDYPRTGLIQGTDGNFYGTTSLGGVSDQGTLFKISPNGSLATLYSFCADIFTCIDGGTASGLIQGSGGNFYGTTTGIDSKSHQGAVFALTPSGSGSVLYDFCNQPAQEMKAGVARPLTIAEAKRGLALALGVSSDAVEITIRG